MAKLTIPITPAELTRTVALLAESVVPGVPPMYVDCRTVAGEQRMDSFQVVDQQVRNYGGERLQGWVLWELPGVFAEAEFRALWTTPEGTSYDITPRQPPVRRILFLPDPMRPYHGRALRSYRRATVQDPLILTYLNTFDQEYELFERGLRDAEKGTVRLAPDDVPLYEKLLAQRMQLHPQVQLMQPEWGAYSPCWCGSGQKAKWCHGVPAG